MNSHQDPGEASRGNTQLRARSIKSRDPSDSAGTTAWAGLRPVDTKLHAYPFAAPSSCYRGFYSWSISLIITQFDEIMHVYTSSCYLTDINHADCNI